MLQIEGYDFFSMNRGSRGGKVGIYVLTLIKTKTWKNGINIPLKNLWLFSQKLEMVVLYKAQKCTFQESVNILDLQFEKTCN